MNTREMIDYSVYPDVAELVEPRTIEERADYIARICGAWDFGLIPTPQTFQLFNTPPWREAFDRFPLRYSPAYAAFRTRFGWPRIKGGPIVLADYERYEGPDRDPCADMV